MFRACKFFKLKAFNRTRRLKESLGISKFDSENNNSASKAALGIYNPITGIRKALTWNLHKVFNGLEKFYT